MSGNNGGQSPGQQDSYQTQNTTSTSGPNPTIQPWLENLSNKLGGYLNQHQSAPSLFGGSFTAPMSDATKSGIAALTNFGNSGNSPLYQAGTTLATDTMNGKLLDPGNNPYLQKYLRAGLDQQNDSFNALAVPGIRSQFAGSGRNLGGLDVDAVVRARNNLDRAQADATAGAEGRAYGDERGRQLQTQSMLPSFQGMDLARAGALGQAGNMWDAYNQKLTDEAILRDTHSKTGDLDYWTNMAQRFLGGMPGGTTTGTGTSSGYTRFMPPSNSTSNILGALMGGAGLGLSAYSAFGGSDARIKEGIKPVGKLNDGQTVYSYRFLGSPKTEIGLLAQEVEKRHPEAVVTHPSGVKMVHYGMATANATPPGGLM
jgi:Chaperone of endosialidase